MAEKYPSLTSESDLQKISDCGLYDDLRVSHRSHTFCSNCSDAGSSGAYCPLCRPFNSIPDDGCAAFP